MENQGLDHICNQVHYTGVNDLASNQWGLRAFQVLITGQADVAFDWGNQVWCLDELRGRLPGNPGLPSCPLVGCVSTCLSVRPRNGRCWFAPWPPLCVPSWGGEGLGQRSKWPDMILPCPLQEPRRYGACDKGAGTNLSCRRWYSVPLSLRRPQEGVDLWWEQEPALCTGGGTQSCVSQEKGRVKKNVHSPGLSHPESLSKSGATQWAHGKHFKGSAFVQIPWLGWWRKKSKLDK